MADLPPYRCSVCGESGRHRAVDCPRGKSGASRVALRFVVPGPPVGKGRPRFQMRGGKPHTFTPDETLAFEGRVRAHAAEAMRLAGVALLEGPVELRVRAVWVALASKSKKGRPGEPKASRPDADNVLKAVADALNAVVYRDDAQVVTAHVEKWRAATGEPARVEVEVIPLGASA